MILLRHFEKPVSFFLIFPFWGLFLFFFFEGKFRSVWSVKEKGTLIGVKTSPGKEKRECFILY